MPTGRYRKCGAPTIPGSVVPANKLSYQVTNEEQAIISITATTAHTDASWYLRVDYSVDGVAAAVDVGDPDHPFHTAPDAGYPITTLKIRN